MRVGLCVPNVHVITIIISRRFESTPVWALHITILEQYSMQTPPIYTVSALVAGLKTL